MCTYVSIACTDVCPLHDSITSILHFCGRCSTWLFVVGHASQACSVRHKQQADCVMLAGPWPPHTTCACQQALHPRAAFCDVMRKTRGRGRRVAACAPRQPPSDSHTDSVAVAAYRAMHMTSLRGTPARVNGALQAALTFRRHVNVNYATEAF